MLQNIVVCQPASVQQAPCPAGQAVAVVEAYVLDASQQAAYEASVFPIDYVMAGAFWAFSFSFVVGLFLLSKSAGTVLALIRR